MRNKKAKEIRKEMNFSKDHPLLKKIYRRYKKIYSRTPAKEKANLMSVIKGHSALRNF